MGKFTVLICAFVVLCAVGHITDATICRPLSKFKMDCNTCVCSSDGRKYSCTRKNCLEESYMDALKFDYNGVDLPQDDTADWSLEDVSEEDDFENIDDLPDNYRFRRGIRM